MKFTNLDNKRQYLNEEILKLQNEVILLTKEKDLILTEIKEQRRGKTVVYKQTVDISSQIDGLESLLTSLSGELKSKKNQLYSLEDAHKVRLNKVKDTLTALINQASLYEQKKTTIIDIDEINLKHKDKISKNNEELQNIIDEIKLLRKEKKETIKFLEEEKETIKQEKDKIENNKQALKIKDQRLTKREEKFLKLKNSNNGKKL